MGVKAVAYVIHKNQEISLKDGKSKMAFNLLLYCGYILLTIKIMLSSGRYNNP